MMKSDIEETHSISSVVDASDGKSTPEAFSSHKSKDELSSPKMSSRNKTSEIPLSTKSFSMPSSIDGLKSFDGENDKSPTCIKTTSESEEKCHDNFLSNGYIKSDNEDTHSKSHVAYASREISREEVSSFKTVDKPSALNFPARAEIWETTILAKPSSRSQTMDKLLPFNVEDTHSLTPTNIFSDTEEIYSDSSNPCKKQTNFESKETSSRFSITDATDMVSDEEMSSAYKLKDESLLEKKSFRSESQSEIPSNLISVQSKMLTNINTDNGPSDHANPSSSTSGNHGLSVCLICSSMGSCCFYTMHHYYEEKMSLRIKSEGDEAHPLLTAKDEAILGLASNYNLTDGSLALWSRTRDETADVPSFTESLDAAFSTVNRMSSETQTDLVCPELGTSFPLCDDSDSSSSSSSVGDYYDDDEDIQRFCLQDELTLPDEASYKLEFKDENAQEPNLVESNESSDRSCETPICEFKPKEGESSEGYLLMQIQEFFSHYPLDDNEIMSRQESINSIITSRYFTDEFAQQHGLTVSGNGVERIGNALEDDSDERVTRQSSDPNLFRR